MSQVAAEDQCKQSRERHSEPLHSCEQVAEKRSLVLHCEALKAFVFFESDTSQKSVLRIKGMQPTLLNFFQHVPR